MKLALFGYGGHAREVAAQINEPIEFFVDDKYSNEYTKPISSFDPKIYSIMVAVADSRERKKIVETLPNDTKYFTFVHPTVLMMNKDISKRCSGITNICLSTKRMKYLAYEAIDGLRLMFPIGRAIIIK